MEEHRKMFQIILKIVQKEPTYVADNSSQMRELRESMDKYLKAPGTLVISKSLHDVYKSLEIEGYKEGDESINSAVKSDNGPSKSESEVGSGPVRDLIVRLDNKAFEFQPINTPKSETKSFMEMFKSSFTNKPNESDFIPTWPKKEKLNPDSHSIFPKYRMIEESTIKLMDVETIFFIFYFQPNQYEKYLAAKELKHRDWRFHKKFSLWFKRQKEPSVTTTTYEQGDVYIFDFEDSWKVKKRPNFTFDYKHLEDELQV